MTLKAALEEAAAAIGRTDAQVIMAHLLGVNRAYLAANPMRVLTETEDARVDTFVARRSLGHPVAYLLGTREFYSREFAVSPDVLIPRPETETLVEAALERIGAAGETSAARRPRADGGPISVLDLGTGSGAIAITLACERSELAVTATDSSEAALEIARGNAATHAARVEFAHGAWYAPVAGRRFDLIVSNPPYVDASELPGLEPEVRDHEPRGALVPPGDRYSVYRRLAPAAASLLQEGAVLALEVGQGMAEEVARICHAAGLETLPPLADLNGIPRTLVARRTAS